MFNFCLVLPVIIKKSVFDYENYIKFSKTKKSLMIQLNKKISDSSKSSLNTSFANNTI